jgi:alpha-beta hydrolase superfamily lysophospholipase
MKSTSNRPRRALRIAKVTGVVLVILSLFGYLAISLVTADMLTRPSNRPAGLDPRAVSADATPWSTVTSDGLRLRGWYFPSPSHRNLLVLVHGMQENWVEMAGLGHDLHLQGYDILLFDLRGHGRSDPSRLFMGRRERGDIRAVLNWAKRHGFSPDRVGWLGNSMGASTVLMEGARNPEIRVAVLDSPYGSLPELLNAQLPEHSHLPRLFTPGILLAARWAYGVRTDDLVPIRDARRWGDRPLLVIHGEADSIVPARHARLLARAAGRHCSAIMLPGVEHTGAYHRYRRGYVAAVDRFFDEHLSH